MGLPNMPDFPGSDKLGKVAKFGVKKLPFVNVGFASHDATDAMMKDDQGVISNIKSGTYAAANSLLWGAPGVVADDLGLVAENGDTHGVYKTKQEKAERKAEKQAEKEGHSKGVEPEGPSKGGFLSVIDNLKDMTSDAGHKSGGVGGAIDAVKSLANGHPILSTAAMGAAALGAGKFAYDKVFGQDDPQPMPLSPMGYTAQPMMPMMQPVMQPMMQPGMMPMPMQPNVQPGQDLGR